ncbi:MAG: hypothetical protein Edafosvirus18_6 [Edafosvirus sp.]|uniref:Uncharacterized protein n=1 Tax=Edafosvirus sp. TaxID=2487765 RepID=A0A3G4ZUI8_9VIRU|nr:MAG: hypothetical protein Edafosvirus18_6 [Edafosvirus sp.]
MLRATLKNISKLNVIRCAPILKIYPVANKAKLNIIHRSFSQPFIRPFSTINSQNISSIKTEQKKILPIFKNDIIKNQLVERKKQVEQLFELFKDFPKLIGTKIENVNVTYTIKNGKQLVNMSCAILCPDELNYGDKEEIVVKFFNKLTDLKMETADFEFKWSIEKHISVGTLSISFSPKQ